MPKKSRALSPRSLSNSARGSRAGGKAGKRALGPRAKESLASASTALNAGDHEAAATGFSALSAIAGERGLSQVATITGLKASVAHLKAGDTPSAADCFRDAVVHGAICADKKRLGPYFHDALAGIKGSDTSLAEALRTEALEKLGAKSFQAAGEPLQPNRAQRRALPKACLTCGAKVDRASIGFSAEGTVDCPQCGDAIL